MYSQPLTATATAIAFPGESNGGLLAAENKVNLDLEIGRCTSASEGELKRERLLSVSCFSPEKSDHSSVMDSEPGRCRRTDGRKWRCSKNVVPLQKYCERHMHRGRQCSRKHVEPVQRVPIPNNHRTSDETRMPILSLVASDVDDRVSVSIQSDLGPSQPRYTYRSGFPAVYGSHDAILANNSIGLNYAPSTCSSSRANCLISGGDHGDGKFSLDDANPINLSCRKQNVVGNNYVGFNSLRYGLSPKSVLNAAGKIGLGSGTMEGVQRCRRTDGKKWQCRRNALHNQKYCEAHMHRGAKRLVVKPEYSRCSKPTPASKAQASCLITRNLDSGINLNTVPASPQRGTSNDSNSSTSDATTITDENISYCLSNNSLHHG
ncbi:growth-regulating factor 9 isoform X2 [Salvia miltiorrhiza]|uniref:growth-regulating factor 9 isoform X2 n=1 Tax=Salvia miltiorrhiza TaxID=226208 RepID=UPI0025AC3B12|nr:growth-regulating factor 9 isoform X2 [Salvia miltiorrhiza]